MSTLKRVPKLLSLALDTNIFIYHFDKKSPFHERASRLFETVTKENKKLFTSTITLAELLSLPAPIADIKMLRDEMLHVPNLRILAVSVQIATLSAHVRRKYGFRLPDAIQLATALEAKAHGFVTNDKTLKKCKEVKVLQLDEL